MFKKSTVPSPLIRKCGWWLGPPRFLICEILRLRRVFIVGIMLWGARMGE